MPPPFPAEIWALIARYAIGPQLDPNRFTPPIGDFESIQGFVKVSTMFEMIIRTLKDEIFVASTLEFPYLKIADNEARRVRYLEVTVKDELDYNRPVLDPVFFRSMFFRRIASFSLVTTLSLSPPASPLICLEQLQGLPISYTLRCLDIRGKWVPLHRVGVYPMESAPVSFPNLMRLRFSVQTWEGIDFVVDKDFINKMAALLSDCQNLNLLSFHTALDDQTTWNQQFLVHKSSLEHLQPSEGYERDISDCPLCSGSYDHASVIRRENSSTRILAQTLPSLTEVRWANLWVRAPEDESGQRGTKISREGGNIILSRDDGQDA